MLVLRELDIVLYHTYGRIKCARSSLRGSITVTGFTSSELVKLTCEFTSTKESNNKKDFLAIYCCCCRQCY